MLDKYQGVADSQHRSYSLTVGAWVVAVLVSSLPDSIWQAFVGTLPSWLLWGKIGLLFVLIILTFAWHRIQSLRLFFLMLLVLVPASQWLFAWLPTLSIWKQWFGQAEWIGGTAVIQLIKTGVAFLMMGILLIMGRRRRDFFLTKGYVSAPAENIPWLGIKGRTSWSRVGPIIAVSAFVPVLAVLWLSNPPSSALLVKAVPYLPVTILFAAMNGFSEEMSFRAPVLNALQDRVSRQHALMLTAVYFGLAHYGGGVSSGIIWVVFAGFLGWLMGRSMLETKGAFWAWFIHFVEDVPIYFFMAIDYFG